MPPRVVLKYQSLSRAECLQEVTAIISRLKNNSSLTNVFRIVCCKPWATSIKPHFSLYQNTTLSQFTIKIYKQIRQFTSCRVILGSVESFECRPSKLPGVLIEQFDAMYRHPKSPKNFFLSNIRSTFWRK